MPKLSARLTRLEAEAAERIALATGGALVAKQLVALDFIDLSDEEFEALPGDGDTRFDAAHGRLVIRGQGAEAIHEFHRSQTAPNGPDTSLHEGG